MVRVIAILLCLASFQFAGAKDIYVNSDTAAANPGTFNGAGTMAAPWNFARLQSEFAKTTGSAIVPGDNIWLNRGKEYFGQLVCNVSGTASQPIYVGAYGTGAMPIITGFTRITAFTKVGNLYTSLPFSSLADIKTVIVNGEMVTPGRWPNDDGVKGTAIAWGWHRSTATGTNTSVKTRLSRITRAQAASVVGATAMVRTSRWTIDSVRIGSFTVSADTASADSILTFTYSKGATQYAHPNGYGFFFQNKKEFCDIEKEWSYAGGALSIYLNNPSSAYEIKAATVDNVLVLNNTDYVSFEGIRIEGANFDGVRLDGTATNIVFTNGEIQYCGSKAVEAHMEGSVERIMITYNKIWDAGNFGVDHREAGSYFNISYNDFQRIGHLPGLAVVDIANQSCAIRGGGGGVAGKYHIYDGNKFDIIGYCAIRFNGDHSKIRFNIGRRFNYTLDDSGGIYTAKSTSKDSVIIEYNFLDATPAGNPLQGAGINNSLAIYNYYMDDEAGGRPGREIIIRYNIGINAPRAGLYIHNGHNFRIYNNTFYNNTEAQLQVVNDRNAVTNTYTNDDTTYNVWSKGNKMVSLSTATAHEIAKYFTINNTAEALKKLDEMKGTPDGVNLVEGIDSNYYFKPFHASQDWVYAIWNYSNTNPVASRISIANWFANFGHDRNSKVSPVKYAGTTRPDTALAFYYNIGTADTVITLTKSYKNEDGEILYPGKLTLKPWETAVLFRYEATAPVTPPPPPPPVLPGETDVVGYDGPYAVVTRTGEKVMYGPYLVVKYLPVYRQNFFTNSEAINLWGKSSAVTSVANTVLAPNDSLSAEAFTTVVSTSSLQHNIFFNLAVKQDTLYTFSVHAKAGSHRYLQLYSGTGGFGSTAFANFDLQEGTATYAGTGVITTGVTAKKNGWYEVWFTARATGTSGSTGQNINLISGPTDKRAAFYVVPSATTLYLWGAQFATGEKRGYSKTSTTAIQ